VARLLLVTGIYTYGVPRTSRGSGNASARTGFAQRPVPQTAGDMVTEAHQRRGLRTMVVRLPDFYGPHTGRSMAGRIFGSALDGKTANWVGPASTPHEFIFVPDTAPVLANWRGAGCYGERGTWRVETISGRFHDACLSRGGTRSGLPLGGPHHAENGGSRQPDAQRTGGDAVPARDAGDSRRPEMAATLGILAKTSYDDGIRRTLEWMRAQ